MPKYAVKSSITADRVYLPGDVIELSEEAANAMPWAVGDALPDEAPVPAVPPAPPKKPAKKAE